MVDLADSGAIGGSMGGRRQQGEAVCGNGAGGAGCEAVDIVKRCEAVDIVG